MACTLVIVLILILCAIAAAYFLSEVNRRQRHRDNVAKIQFLGATYNGVLTEKEQTIRALAYGRPRDKLTDAGWAGHKIRITRAPPWLTKQIDESGQDPP